MTWNGSGFSLSSGRRMLSESAQRRLVMYVKRAKVAPPEHVHRPGLGRRVRYLPAELRQIVWGDVEVRDVLLDDANLDELAGMVTDRGVPGCYALLDLMCAMSLEAERREATG
jgi:hypothetical protein